ncbi:MAG TPA: aldehyde oxidase [Acholeplasmatales bacterium]|nr:aldehyde oxidase [Acholeplasmatales bacterium]
MKNISQSVPLVDYEEKASGKTVFVNDIRMEDLHYAKTVRSEKAHALIKNIAIPALPDGYFTVDASDIPGKNFVKVISEDWPIFAKNTVNHIGEPIMLLVGQDKAVLEEIAKAIKIEYEELTPVFDYQNSAVHKHYSKGHFEGLLKWPHRLIEHTYETGYQEQAYIEPQGLIACLESQRKIKLIGSFQCPYYVKNAVINALGWKSDQVRVIQTAVGGAFGGKEEFPSLMACQLAVAVNKIRKPIKMVYEREEDMLVTTKRHPSRIKLSGIVDDNRRLSGIKAQIALDGGAYVGLSSVVLARSMLAVTGAYTIPNLDVTGDVYVTNTVPTGAFRGFGAPQMIFAIEMFMHHLAEELGIPAYEFRMAHLAKQGDLTSTGGVFRDPIILKELINKVAKASGYFEKYQNYQVQNSFKGIGMSCFFHGCGFTGSGESTQIKAKVKLHKDKSDQVFILVAAVDMGQGARTTLSKIVYDTLQIPASQVTFARPDTDDVPDSGPTVASRTVMIVGGLLARAAQKLRDQWVQNQEITVMEKYQQPDFIKWDDEALQGDAYPAYSWGVNVVETEVDPVTYAVKVIGIWSAYDLGKAIDERIIQGQADGGIAQGIAYGYLEVMRHESGKIKQHNLTDYIIPTSADMAPTQTFLVENPFAFGPYGAKGAGELTLVGGAPAVALAIEQAIKRPIHKIPATPEYIMELMNHETD